MPEVFASFQSTAGNWGCRSFQDFRTFSSLNGRILALVRTNHTVHALRALQNGCSG